MVDSAHELPALVGTYIERERRDEHADVTINFGTTARLA
jgi:hypothetical protein